MRDLWFWIGAVPALVLFYRGGPCTDPWLRPLAPCLEENARLARHLEVLSGLDHQRPH